MQVGLAYIEVNGIGASLEHILHLLHTVENSKPGGLERAARGKSQERAPYPHPTLPRARPAYSPGCFASVIV